jgi:hypothetical protein
MSCQPSKNMEKRNAFSELLKNMKFIRLSSLILCLSAVFIVGFQLKSATFQIPKTWDMAEIKQFILPTADGRIAVTPISEAYYYKLPERKIFKSYPVRLTEDMAANRKYIDSLKTLEPVDFFQNEPKTEQDLIRLGEEVFSTPLLLFDYTDDFYKNLINQEIKNAKVPVSKNIFPYYTYVVDEKSKVKVGMFSCAMCHTRAMDDGSVIKGAQGTFPMDKIDGFGFERDLKSVPKEKLNEFNAQVRADRQALQKAPWINHASQTELDTIDAAKITAYLKAIPPGVLIRHGTNFNQPTTIPDLIGIKDRKYLDYTGSMRHRNIGDLMRYAAFNQTLEMLTSYDGFIPTGIDFKTLPEVGQLPFVGNDKRYSEIQLFALGKYLYSLKPPKNPNSFTPDKIKKGELVFIKEGCVTCHTPPLYTNNKLTPVDGFTPPASHYKSYDIFDVSVETNPELALYTRRGTGYYKVPSLLGLWYRGPFGHSGNVATLEDWLDKRRLEEDYVPTGFKPAFAKTMAVKGHEFGLDISKQEKEALIAFLKSL